VTAGPKLQREGCASWPDDRLVSECLKGHQEAWAALLDKYKNLIFSIPIKLGLYEDAADIFQAVCLDLLTGLPKLRQPRALPKWLMQTCYHHCLASRRKSEKQVQLSDENEEDLAADENVASLPHELLVEVEQAQMVRDALSELSPRCEHMIRMLFFETPPRPYEEVAKELGIATGSIGFIRGRCLGKLKRELEEKGF
jgi:RNA polymerase sigma factor (sigma-70 family)